MQQRQLQEDRRGQTVAEYLLEQQRGATKLVTPEEAESRRRVAAGITSEDVARMRAYALQLEQESQEQGFALAPAQEAPLQEVVSAEVLAEAVAETAAAGDDGAKLAEIRRKLNGQWTWAESMGGSFFRSALSTAASVGVTTALAGSGILGTVASIAGQAVVQSVAPTISDLLGGAYARAVGKEALNEQEVEVAMRQNLLRQNPVGALSFISSGASSMLAGAVMSQLVGDGSWLGWGLSVGNHAATGNWLGLGKVALAGMPSHAVNKLVFYALERSPLRDVFGDKAAAKIERWLDKIRGAGDNAFSEKRQLKLRRYLQAYGYQANWLDSSFSQMGAGLSVGIAKQTAASSLRMLPQLAAWGAQKARLDAPEFAKQMVGGYQQAAAYASDELQKWSRIVKREGVSATIGMALYSAVERSVQEQLGSLSERQLQAAQAETLRFAETLQGKTADELELVRLEATTSNAKKAAEKGYAAVVRSLRLLAIEDALAAPIVAETVVAAPIVAVAAPIVAATVVAETVVAQAAPVVAQAAAQAELSSLRRLVEPQFPTMRSPFLAQEMLDGLEKSIGSPDAFTAQQLEAIGDLIDNLARNGDVNAPDYERIVKSAQQFRDITIRPLQEHLKSAAIAAAGQLPVVGDAIAAAQVADTLGEAMDLGRIIVQVGSQIQDLNLLRQGKAPLAANVEWREANAEAPTYADLKALGAHFGGGAQSVSVNRAFKQLIFTTLSGALTRRPNALYDGGKEFAKTLLSGHEENRGAVSRAVAAAADVTIDTLGPAISAVNNAKQALEAALSDPKRGFLADYLRFLDARGNRVTAAYIRALKAVSGEQEAIAFVQKHSDAE